MIRVVAILLLTAMLAGCLASGPNAVTAAFQGSGGGSDEKSLECDENGNLAYGVQGQGSVKIRVTDGQGTAIFDQTVGASSGGQEGSSQSLSGAAGTWTLTVQRSESGGFAGFGGTTFNGQYGITLTC